MKKLSVLAILLLITSFGKLQAQSEKLIDFNCYDGKSKIFPNSWLTKDVNANATKADVKQFKIDSAIVMKAFDKYADVTVQNKLRHIYFVGKLHFNGQSFFGTNSNENIYIAIRGNDEIEKTFHHEFSSILLSHYKDDNFETKWKALSPELGNTNSADAVKAGFNSTGFDTALCAKGYLSSYSLSNWENDFNMYAENMFAGGKAFWKIVDAYPKVAVKVKLMVDFYNFFGNGYSEIYFRRRAEDE